MAVDIFLVNSYVIYVLIGSERIQNMSETDSVAKRVWHWWLMLSWHYSGHCLYPHEEKHNKKMKTWAFRKCWRNVWCLRDVVLEGVEYVVFVRLVQRGSSVSWDSTRANLPLYYIAPSFQFQSTALASSRDERTEEHSSRWGHHQHPSSPAPHQPLRVSRIIERLSTQMNSNAARYHPRAPRDALDTNQQITNFVFNQ